MKPVAVILSALFAAGVLVGIVWLGRYGGALPVKNAQTAQAKPSVPPPIAETGPYPKVVIEEADYNFGTMAVGTEGHHTYVVRNEGEAPLMLKLERTTCKCTLSNLTKEAVAPGKSTEVGLTWKLVAPAEEFRQSAVITTNDPEHPTIELTVNGKARPVLLAGPPDTWSLGVIAEREPTTVSGLLYSSIVDQFQIVEITSSNKLLSAEASPASKDRLKALEGISGYVIHVSLAPGVQMGQFRGTLTFHTNLDDAKEFHLDIEGTRKGPVYFLPSQGVKWFSTARLLDLGTFRADKGKTATLSMFVTGSSRDEFKILKAESDNELVKVAAQRDSRPQEADQVRYLLTFEVPPGSPPSHHLRKSAVKVTITTNYPDLPEIQMRIQFVSL